MWIKTGVSLSLFCLAIAVSGCQQHNESLDTDAAAMARMKLGLAYLAKAEQSNDNIQLAYANLKKAEQYAPNNTHVMLALALFNQHVGEYAAAEQLFKAVLTKEPQNGPYRLHYAVFLCSKPDYTSAKSQFETAMALDNHEWKADSFEQYAYCAAQNNDFNTANQYFKQLFKYDPSRRKKVKKTATLYQEKGDPKTANYLLSITNTH